MLAMTAAGLQPEIIAAILNASPRRIAVVSPMQLWLTWRHRKLVELFRVIPAGRVFDPAAYFARRNGRQAWNHIIKTTGLVVVLTPKNGTLGRGQVADLVRAYEHGATLVWAIFYRNGPTFSLLGDDWRIIRLPNGWVVFDDGTGYPGAKTVYDPVFARDPDWHKPILGRDNPPRRFFWEGRPEVKDMSELGWELP